MSIFLESSQLERGRYKHSDREQNLLNAVKVPPGGGRTRDDDSHFINISVSMNVQAWMGVMG